MLQALAANRRAAEKERQDKEDSSPGAHSPSKKTVLGAVKAHQQKVAVAAIGTVSKSNKAGDDLSTEPPRTIEDVPFRRQDRRILNSRKKRIMDRKLIKCIIFSGIVGILIGGAMIGLGLAFDHVEEKLDAMVLAGGVFLLMGVMQLIFSVEIWMRLQKNVKRVQDPEIDQITNVHHIKHWVNPEMIPYGWGHDESTDDSSIGANNHNKNNVFLNDHAELASSRGGAGINKVDDEEEYVITVAETKNDDESLLKVKMASMAESEDLDDIGSDIFDESLRFSHVDRPKLLIDRSSPTARKTGEFQTEEERIAGIFKT